MVNKIGLVLVLAVVVTGGVFAAVDLSKYQYFYIDKKTTHWDTTFAAYEPEITEAFETCGLKYLSEKQLNALSAKDKETVLMLQFVLGNTEVILNLLDYSSDRILTKCTVKFNALDIVMGIPVKGGVQNALKAAKKLYGKK